MLEYRVPCRPPQFTVGMIIAAIRMQRRAECRLVRSQNPMPGLRVEDQHRRLLP
jgi:hypothetical protein